VGYALVQQTATNAMKKYGVRIGFFGPSRKEIERAIETLRSQPSPQPSLPLNR
jgi:hypothetical protein